jgi:hypothetical protein
MKKLSFFAAETATAVSLATATFVALTATLLALAGCSQNAPESPSERGIKVFSTIVGADNGPSETRTSPASVDATESGGTDPVSGENHGAYTRASGNSWDAGDQIGIYMLPTGATGFDNALKTNANYRHESGTTNGSFAPVGSDDALYYPAEGGEFDFVAYYPYNAGVQASGGHTYPVDITEQNPLKAIDLLYTERRVTQNETQTSLGLTFSHQLAKVVFRITDREGVSLAGATAAIEGMDTAGAFDLETGELAVHESIEPVIPVVDATEDLLTIEAIVLPGVGLDYDVVVTLGNAERETAIIEMRGRTLEKGKNYLYTARLVRDRNDDPIAIEMVGAEIVDWEPGNGAGEEIGDVGKGDGAEGAWAEVLNETFTGLGGSNDTTDGGGSYFDGNENFPDHDLAIQSGDAIRIGTTEPGYIVSRSLDLSGGPVRISLRAKGWTTVEGALVVEVGDVSKTIPYNETIYDGFGSYTVDFDAIADNTTITIMSEKRSFVDDIVVEVKK